MANLTVSADIDALMASANNAAARASLNVPESPAGYAGDFTGSNSASLPGTFGVTTGDFTVEVFINRLGNSGVGHILCDQVNGLVLYSNGANIYFSQTGGLTVVSGALSVDSNWHHVATVRESGTASLYVDGTRISTVSDSTNFTTSGSAEIGQLFSQSGGNFIGKIGNVRISNIARYSGATCTVPTNVFVSDANTLNLFLQSASLDATLTPHPSVTMVSGALSGVFVAESRTLTAGTGLTGGGDLSADRTFAVAYGTSAGTAAQGNDSRITGAAKSANVQTFTSSGTWTKPAGAKSVQVLCIGGGNGGASGRRGASLSTIYGGGGGAGGGYTSRTVDAALLGATEAVTIGAGGSGAAGQIVDNTNGSNGGTGGISSFGTYVFAGIGTFAAGGTSAAGGGGSTASERAMFAGGGGGSSSVSAGAGAGTLSYSAGAGGGGGGGISATPAAFAGGAGGISFGANVSAAAATAGAVPGGAGAAGTSAPANWALAGFGGAGGAGNILGAGGNGGAGGTYGGAGGGGGASLNGNVSGAGGAGAQGIVIVTTYF